MQNWQLGYEHEEACACKSYYCLALVKKLENLIKEYYVIIFTLFL
jgi:hypothetical protein